VAAKTGIDLIDEYGYPMPEDTVADKLDRTEWSREFNFKEITSLAEHLKAVMVPDGNIIIREDTREDFMCILLAGEAIVVKKDMGGAKKELGQIRIGHAVGEQALIDDRPRSATVEARTECRLLVFTKDDMRFMEVEKPRLLCKVLLKVAQDLSERLRLTSASLVDASN
jgi:CRP/FNR family cyclic AMP-dependent transcriptional regulator